MTYLVINRSSVFVSPIKSAKRVVFYSNFFMLFLFKNFSLLLIENVCLLSSKISIFKGLKYPSKQMRSRAILVTENKVMSITMYDSDN